MRRKRRALPRAFDWNQLPKIVLLLGAAVFSGWLAVRSAAIDTFVRRNPYAAASFSPHDPRVLLALAMAEFRQNAGAIGPRTANAATAALRKNPLAEEPFLLAGVSALRRKDEKAAERLLMEARERNPRSRTTRILLLDRYLRTQRVNEASVEIATLSRLIPAARQALVPELAKFWLEPRTSASLARVLRSDPDIREDVLNHLAATADPKHVLKLAANSSAPSSPSDIRPWQRLLVDRLVKKGELRRAHELWRGFAGVRDRTENVYDGRFQGLPGPPPFNWDYVSSPAGVAEKASGPAMQVEYYGRQPALLAAQLVMLPPGKHRLGFRAEGDAVGDGSAVTWKIECLGSNAELASVMIRNISYSGKAITVDFIVPGSGCAAQWLRLVGVSAEFPTPQSLSITDVQIRDAGQP